MTEASAGLARPEMTPEYIATTRNTIFAEIASQGRNELLRFSKFSERKGSLSPGAPEFEALPASTQNLIRKSTASVTLKPIGNEMARIIRSGVFSPQRVFDETSALLEGTSAKNPFPVPDEPEIHLSIQEWEQIVKISAEDPTLMRLFNIGFKNIPHSMRTYFQRLGTFLWFIDRELIPEAEERLQREGVPQTYRKRPFKKVEIRAEHPIGYDEHRRRMIESHPRPQKEKPRKIHFRRRSRSIWQT